jgi:hypothetical protein
MLPHCPGVGDTGPHTFRNQIAFELGDGTHDVEQKLAAWGRGIDALGEADEINPQRSEFFEAIDQVLDGAGEAVEFPHQDNIEEALVSALHECIELRSATLCPADTNIDVLVNTAKSLAGKATQVA